MVSYTLRAFLCTVLRQTRFRLVQDFKWSYRSSVFSQLSNYKLKSQLIRYPEVFNYFQPLSVFNNFKMPKYKLEKSLDGKTKEKNQTHLDVLKHVKKKKKEKKRKKKKHREHSHRRKLSKKHSTQSHSAKLSAAKKVEIVLLDLSSDNDSDLLIVYDSRFSVSNVNCQREVSLNSKVEAGKASCSSEQSLKFITEENNPSIADTKANECIGDDVKEFHVSNSDAKTINDNCGESTSNLFVESMFKTDQDKSGLSYVSTSNTFPKRGKQTNRPWHYTNFGKRMAAFKKDNSESNGKYMMFDVLSYNVLCQEIMEEHMELYTRNDRTALDWNYRSNLLMKEFLQFDSDVMCLQEVQQSHLESFYSKLESIGYSGLFKQRTGNKTDGVAIYYKNSRFDLIDYTTVEYYQPGISVLNRDNVGLIVKLAPKVKPDERIIIATTHLLYNPRRHDVKLAQLQVLLAEVERFAFKGMKKRAGSAKYWPVILTGDMNMEPYTGGFRLLSTGSFQYEGLSSKTLTRTYNGFESVLGKELIPPDLGVTDSCQHHHIIANRQQLYSTAQDKCSKDDHKSEEPLLRIYNSDFEVKSCDVGDSNNVQMFRDKSSSQKGFGSGGLTHDLQLSSVYIHDPYSYDKSQVSTFQSEWVVVDYIFYSNDGSCDLTKSNDGNLKLVARYKLFNEKQASIIGPIPNLSSPSDHYPLAAKFALML